MTVVYLTSGGSWSNPGGVTQVEVIGGGGAGQWGNSTNGQGTAGGGGGYASWPSPTGLGASVTTVVGAVATIAISTGAGGAGNFTCFNGSTVAASSVGANGGAAGLKTTTGSAAGGTGGGTGTGVTTHSGGAAGSVPSYASTANVVGAGGAGGTLGVGGAGGAGAATTIGSPGGGGNGGGSAGSTVASGTTGANGGNNNAGSGHGTGSATGVAGGAGSAGGGGGGSGTDASSNVNGGAGGAGTDWDATHGGGGGQGGGSGTSAAVVAGSGGAANYGGGGSGCGNGAAAPSATYNSGAQGIIRITLTSGGIAGTQWYTTAQPDPNAAFPLPLRSFTQPGGQLLLTGQDQFPPGKTSFETPAQPDGYNRELRNWARSYNPNLVGKDKFPPGQREFSTPAYQQPETFAQWRSWFWQFRQLLVGQDRLPPGRSWNELPRGNIWQPESPPQNLLNTLLVPLAVPLPPGVQLCELPPRVFDIFSNWRTWTARYNPNLIGQDVLPFRNFNELPQGITWRPESPPQNLVNTLFVVPPTPPPPGSQVYELSPRVQDAFAQWRSFTGSYNLNLIGQDLLPFRVQNELPRGITWQPESVPQNLTLTLLAPQAIPPGVQTNALPAGITWQPETPQPLLLALLTAPPPVPPVGAQLYDLPPFGPQQLAPTTAQFNVNLFPPPPPPVITATYNTMLLCIPGGMFSIPGDPPS